MAYYTITTAYTYPMSQKSGKQYWKAGMIVLLQGIPDISEL
jgi:hypothetical protein